MEHGVYQIARAYCRDHQDEFSKWLNVETSRLLATPQFMFTGAAAFAVFTAINYFAVYGARCLPAYAASIFLFLAYRVLRDVFGHKMDNISPYYMDLIALSSLAGVLYMVHLAISLNHTLINSPVQAALLLLCILSYHTSHARNLARNLGLTVLVSIGLYFIDPDYMRRAFIQIATGLLPGVYVNNFVIRSLQIRFYHVRTNSKARDHAFKQLSSAFYPHQVERMEAGEQLEDTMPVGQSNAYVICFDIINSSSVLHEGFHDVRDRIFGRCYDVMLESYQFNPLTANAHRIKDLGDGFLCSVGFPFAVPHGRKGAELALHLAHRFVSIFDEEIAKMEYIAPVYCSIGIAHGTVEAFYPSSGLRLYDLRDSAIILANRYESMRKVIFAELGKQLKNRVNGNIITVQEKVFVNLSAKQRQTFQEWDAVGENRAVRDDPEAKRAYYQIFAPGSITVKNESAA